jgi:hypothetical protein
VLPVIGTFLLPANNQRKKMREHASRVMILGAVAICSSFAVLACAPWISRVPCLVAPFLGVGVLFAGVNVAPEVHLIDALRKGGARRERPR